MLLSLAEKLTTHFYDWEKRGRGWDVYNAPVDLEPPFEPFFFHAIPEPKYIDDGKRHTILSGAIDFFKNKFSASETLEYEIPFENIPLEAYFFHDTSTLRVLKLSLPKGQKVQIADMEQLLLMLSYCKLPLSFEIIGSHSSIVIQLVCREPDVLHVQSQVKAYFPNCIAQEEADSMGFILVPELTTSIIDFGLREEFMRPINTVKSFDLDPFIGLMATLEHLMEHEYGVIQVMFSGAVNSWSESIMQSVTDNNGDSFFLDAPEMLPLAKEKISKPLFGAVIRVIGGSQLPERSRFISKNVGIALCHLSNSGNNGLIPLSNQYYEPTLHLRDVVLRQSHRLGMLLNASELLTLIHLPNASVSSSKLERDTKRSKIAPSIVQGHNLILGINHHQGKNTPISLTSDQRFKHTYAIGATGTGKSTMLLNLIMQDIAQGRGVAVLDPHGDVIESILSRIPEERKEDVILIDPADVDFPVGFNILSAYSEIEKDTLSSDLVAIFRRLSTSWGDQMNSVFANAILAFLESKLGGTLADLRRFLVEKSFRDSFLKTVTDPNIAYYWQKEFPLLKSNSIAPILTRLDTFLRPKLIRNMVSQKQGLDFENILNSNKILLVKVSQGLIGAENSYLLGTLIVAKIHQAALARQIQKKEERNDFFLYIDEFQNFITPSVSEILSGTRKYHLGLILTHQDMQQLSKDAELAGSVFNAGTRICFRVGDIDAKKMEGGFSYFEAKDLQNLETGEAIVRVERPEYDFNLKTIPLPDMDMGEAEKVREEIISLSRAKYSTPKELVEQMLGISREEVETIEKRHSVAKEIEKPKETVRILPKENPQVSIPDAPDKQAISQHRYLQNLIKRMAESRGYKASIEEPTPDGKGRVDVSLERNGKRIACEISVTTSDIWELQNIQKCLGAGYDTVVACSSESKTLGNIRKQIEANLNEAERKRVLVYEPDALFLYLDEEIAKEASTETRIKGYRVKVEYDAVSPKEMEKKRESVAQVVLESLKKMKK